MRMLVPFRLSALFGVLFSVVAIQLTFWPIWLAAQGLDAAAVGLVVSVGYWMRILGDPLAGLVADRTGTRRRAMIAICTIALLAACSLLWSRSFPTILVASLLWTGAFSALVPLGDNLALLTARARGLDYARLRVWGSVGFVASAALAGRLLTDRPADTVLHLLLAGLAAALLACFALPELPSSAGVTPQRRPSPWPLLRNAVYLRFLLAAGLAQASHGVLYAFASLHWQDAGMSREVIGLLWIEGVLAEIALFTFGRGFVDRLGAARLLGLAAIAGVVRWTLLAGTDSLPLVLLAQALHGLTFGASHLAAMRFILEAVPTSHSATGQTLYTGLALGAGYGLSIMLSGPLYAVAGGGAFLAMSVLSALAFLIAWSLARNWRPGEMLALRA
jgi:MFS transporter, PPP family, 3-phenylpropionic acid transporter